jgi:phosphohistidine phosphatase
VLVSPARRTSRPPQALDRKFKTVPALAPDGTVDAPAARRALARRREPVLVVGHQPTLGLAAAYLLAGQPLALGGAQGRGVVAARARARRRAQVVLHAVMSPELL